MYAFACDRENIMEAKKERAMQQQRGRDRFEAASSGRRPQEHSIRARIFMASWWVLFLLPWLLVSWGPLYVIGGYVLMIVLIGFFYRWAFGSPQTPDLSQQPGAYEEGYRAVRVRASNAMGGRAASGSLSRAGRVGLRRAAPVHHALVCMSYPDCVSRIL